MFYIEEKQPNGRWKRGRFHFATIEKAQATIEQLNERGSCGPLRLWDTISNHVVTIEPLQR